MLVRSVALESLKSTAALHGLKLNYELDAGPGPVVWRVTHRHRGTKKVLADALFAAVRETFRL